MSTVRLSVEIPSEVNEQLARFLPWGTKAEAVRALVELLIRAHIKDDSISHNLLRGKCELVIQNLKTTDARKEEK